MRRLIDRAEPKFERNSAANNKNLQVAQIGQPRYEEHNYAMRFNGNSRVYVNPNPAFDDDRGITVEAWFAASNRGGVIHKGVGNIHSWLIQPTSSDTCRVRLWGSTNALDMIFSSPGILSGRFNHVAFTFDQHQFVRFYWNGEYIGGDTLNVGNLIKNLPVLIGHYPGSNDFGHYLDGVVDEARIWNVARTHEQILAGMNQKIKKAPGLIARYSFDETRRDNITEDTAERINLLPENIANGGESGSSAGFSPIGALVSSSDEESWQGNRSIKVITNGGATLQGAFSSYHLTPILPNQQYTGSVYAKGVGTMRLMMRFVNKDIGDTVDFTEEIVLSDEWQRVSVTGTSRSNSSFCSLLCRIAGTVATTFYLDGLQVQEGNVLSPWTPTKTNPYNGSIAGGATHITENPLGMPYGSSSMVEEGTTNKVLDVRNWALQNNSGQATATNTTFQGIPAVELHLKNGDRFAFTDTVNWADRIVTGGFRVFPESTLGVDRIVAFVDGGTVGSSGNDYTKHKSGNYLYFVGKKNVTDSESVNVGFIANADVRCVIYAPQLEAKEYSTSYVLGLREQVGEVTNLLVEGELTHNWFPHSNITDLTWDNGVATFTGRGSANATIHNWVRTPNEYPELQGKPVFLRAKVRTHSSSGSIWLASSYSHLANQVVGTDWTYVYGKGIANYAGGAQSRFVFAGASGIKFDITEYLVLNLEEHPHLADLSAHRIHDAIGNDWFVERNASIPLLFPFNSRENEKIQIDSNGVLSNNRGQIDIDVLLQTNIGINQTIFDVGYKKLGLYRRTDLGKWMFSIGGVEHELPDISNGWHRFTVVWNSSKAWVYCDGVEILECSGSFVLANDDLIRLGFEYFGGVDRYFLNSEIGGFRAMLGFLLPDEILAEANSPLRKNEITTHFIGFDLNMNHESYMDDAGFRSRFVPSRHLSL